MDHTSCYRSYTRPVEAPVKSTSETRDDHARSTNSPPYPLAKTTGTSFLAYPYQPIFDPSYLESTHLSGVSQTPAGSLLASRSRSVSTGNTDFSPLSPKSVVEHFNVLDSDIASDFLNHRLREIGLFEVGELQASHDDFGYFLPPGEDDDLSLPNFHLNEALANSEIERAIGEVTDHSEHSDLSALQSPLRLPSASFPEPCPLVSEDVLDGRPSSFPRSAVYRLRTRPIRARPVTELSSVESIGSDSRSGRLRSRSQSARTLRGKQNATVASQPRRLPEKRVCRVCEADHNSKKFEFRGQHELVRHNNKHHAVLKKLWVCRDPTPDQRHSWCKNCREEKKYAVNYNAAEHIRRQHLYPDCSERPPKKVRGSFSGARISSMQQVEHEKKPSIEWLVQNNWLEFIVDSEPRNEEASDVQGCPIGHEDETNPEDITVHAHDISHWKYFPTSGIPTMRPSNFDMEKALIWSQMSRGVYGTDGLSGPASHEYSIPGQTHALNKLLNLPVDDEQTRAFGISSLEGTIVVQNDPISQPPLYHSFENMHVHR